MHVRGWCSIGVAAMVLGAAPARGDEAKDADAARLKALLKTGAEAAKTKQWEACIAALGDAVVIDGAATTAGDLGLCEEATGKFALAFAHLRRAIEAAPAEAKEPWNKYRAAMARVRERVAVVLVTAYPSAARVVLDGRPLGPADGRGIAVEPGTHTFSARLEGYLDASETRTMSARDVPQVHLQLTPAPKPAAPAVVEPRPQPTAKPVSSATVSAPAPAPAPAPLLQTPWYQPVWSPGGVLVSITYVSAATLLVSGETALVLELDRQSIAGKLSDSACAPAAASRPLQCAALHERTVQRNTAEGVFIGASIETVLFAGATALAHVLDRSRPRPSVTVSASPYGAGIVAFGAW